MAGYKFRLRFELLPGDRLGCADPEMHVLDTPEGHVINLRSGARGSAIQDHSRASLIGGPFATEREAQVAAERVRRALLLWAVTHRFGLDVGDGKVRGVLTAAGKDYFEKQLGRPVRSDVHGIDVYPDEGDVTFLNISASPSLTKDASQFAREVQAAYTRGAVLSEKQNVAAELYCASFFDNVFRSRFITLVTAVEALLSPERRSDAVQAFVDRVRSSIKGINVDVATQQAMAGALEWMRQESIGQAGRKLAHRLLQGRTYGGVAAGKFFSNCYAIRSQTVHRGAPEDGDVDFLELANRTQEFVGDLLLASINEASAERAQNGSEAAEF